MRHSLLLCTTIFFFSSCGEQNNSNDESIVVRDSNSTKAVSENVESQNCTKESIFYRKQQQGYIVVDSANVDFDKDFKQDKVYLFEKKEQIGNDINAYSLFIQRGNDRDKFYCLNDSIFKSVLNLDTRPVVVKDLKFENNELVFNLEQLFCGRFSFKVIILKFSYSDFRDVFDEEGREPESGLRFSSLQFSSSIENMRKSPEKTFVFTRPKNSGTNSFSDLDIKYFTYEPLIDLALDSSNAYFDSILKIQNADNGL